MEKSINERIDLIVQLFSRAGEKGELRSAGTASGACTGIISGGILFSRPGRGAGSQVEVLLP